MESKKSDVRIMLKIGLKRMDLNNFKIDSKINRVRLEDFVYKKGRITFLSFLMYLFFVFLFFCLMYSKGNLEFLYLSLFIVALINSALLIKRENRIAIKVMIYFFKKSLNHS